MHSSAAGVDVASKDALNRIMQNLAAQGWDVLHREEFTRTVPVADITEASLTAELLETVPLSPAPQSREARAPFELCESGHIIASLAHLTWSSGNRDAGTDLAVLRSTHAALAGIPDGQYPG